MIVTSLAAVGMVMMVMYNAYGTNSQPVNSVCSTNSSPTSEFSPNFRLLEQKHRRKQTVHDSLEKVLLR